MKASACIFLAVSMIFSNQLLACPDATYQSENGVILSLSGETRVQVFSDSSVEYLYSGEIEDYPKEDRDMYSVSPDKLSLGKNATIHLGGKCQYIKMYWWSGEKFKSDFHKYQFKRNA